MAAPTFVQASAGATDATGAFAFTGVAAGTVGDVVIVQVFVDGAGAVSWGTIGGANINDLAGAAGWTEIGLFADNAFAQQRLFIGRRTSATLAPTFTASANTSGDDVYGRLYDFTNVNTGTTLADVLENGTAGATASQGANGSNISHSAIVTLGADRLALSPVGVADDAIGLGAFAGATGGTWTLVTAIYETATGTDASIALNQAAMASAGTISGGTDTISVANPWSSVGFALIGTTVAAGATSDPTTWINERRTPRRRSIQRW